MTLRSTLFKLTRLKLLIVLTVACLFETYTSPATAKHSSYSKRTSGNVCYHCSRGSGRRNQDHGIQALNRHLKKWRTKPPRRYSKAPKVKKYKNKGQQTGRKSRKKQYRSSRSGYAGGSCPQFMNSYGDVGPWGEQVIKLIRSPRYREAYLETSIPGCTNYRSLSDQERELAWVQFFGQLARVESTCNPAVIHNQKIPRRYRGKVQLGIGLFAAEYSKVTRQSTRGQACIGDIRNPYLQISCAVDTLYKTHLSRGRVVVNGGGYFHVLNGGMRRYNSGRHGLSSGMSRYSLCR